MMVYNDILWSCRNWSHSAIVTVKCCKRCRAFSVINNLQQSHWIDNTYGMTVWGQTAVSSVCVSTWERNANSDFQISLSRYSMIIFQCIYLPAHSYLCMACVHLHAGLRLWSFRTVVGRTVFRYTGWSINSN